MSCRAAARSCRIKENRLAYAPGEFMELTWAPIAMLGLASSPKSEFNASIVCFQS